MKNAIVILTLLFGSSLSAIGQFNSGNKKEAMKLMESEYVISNFYVDKVDESKLVVDAIQGMLSKLDPHSEYMTVEEIKAMNEPMQGSFDGIGIQFQMIKDTVNVMMTIVGGPSAKVGLLPGDKVLSVNGVAIAGVKMRQGDVMKNIKGPKGSVANIEVLRPGVSDIISFSIVRDKIPIYSVEASYMATPKVGYIKITQFGENTHKEMLNAISDLKSKGMEDLIIDLQGNGGGLLYACIRMSYEFLDQGKLIVYTEGNKSPRLEERSKLTGNMRTGKIVVLVDEYSASASEILAGAIQDWDRGVIVGRRSFGKGLVQRPFPLSDGSVVKLTTARYYTPSGRSIQKPYDAGGVDYAKDILNRFKHGEFIHKDSIKFPDSLKYQTLVNKRTVYGGGGIMPDVFVPLDTTKYTVYHRNLVAKGVISQFVAIYSLNHKDQIKKKFKSIEKYEANYQLPEDVFPELISQGQTNGVQFDQKQFDLSKGLISLQIKALIARDVFDNAAYYQVMNEEDDIFRQALRVISDDQIYDDLLGNGRR